MSYHVAHASSLSPASGSVTETPSGATTDLEPLTRDEIAMLLEGAMNEPGPRIGVAVCDLGDVTDAVAARVVTTWAGALTDHDIVLPFKDGRRRVVAVIRLRVRSGVEAEALADRLIARASDPIRVEGELTRVRPHVGIAVAATKDSGVALLDRAFNALETAYGVGGRRWSRSLNI
jgi:GGDEF domain-containing protein